MLVVDLTQLVPIDLTPLATAMAFDFGSDFFVRSRGVFQFVDRRRGQIEQVALPFVFTEPLSSSAECPTLVPSQFVEHRGVLLLEFFKRGGRFFQNAMEFRCLLLRRGNFLLKLHRLPVGGDQEFVALGQVVR